jgi:hypothetical protein
MERTAAEEWRGEERGGEGKSKAVLFKSSFIKKMFFPFNT